MGALTFFYAFVFGGALLMGFAWYWALAIAFVGTLVMAAITDGV